MKSKKQQNVFWQKTVPTTNIPKTFKKKKICYIKNFYILLVFLLEFIVLSKNIKQKKKKKKHLLPFNNANIELKKLDINNVL